MQKKLERYPSKGKIAGVCHGLGDYFNIDPVVMRIIFLLLFFVWGGGLLGYLICWAIMPKAASEAVR